VKQFYAATAPPFHHHRNSVPAVLRSHRAYTCICANQLRNTTTVQSSSSLFATPPRHATTPENVVEPPWKHLQESRSHHANAIAAKSLEQPPRRSSRAVTREGEECESKP